MKNFIIKLTSRRWLKQKKGEGFFNLIDVFKFTPNRNFQFLKWCILRPLSNQVYFALTAPWSWVWVVERVIGMMLRSILQALSESLLTPCGNVSVLPTWEWGLDIFLPVISPTPPQAKQIHAHCPCNTSPSRLACYTISLTLITGRKMHFVITIERIIYWFYDTHYTSATSIYHCMFSKLVALNKIIHHFWYQI